MQNSWNTFKTYAMISSQVKNCTRIDEPCRHNVESKGPDEQVGFVVLQARRNSGTQCQDCSVGTSQQTQM